MPETGGYFVSPRRIASIAASLMLSGVSKSGSPAPSPITSRPACFQLARFLRDRDRRGRLNARKGIGKEGHGTLRDVSGLAFRENGGGPYCREAAFASAKAVHAAGSLPARRRFGRAPFPNRSTTRTTVAKAIHLTGHPAREKSSDPKSGHPMLTLYSQQVSGNAYKPRLIMALTRHSLPHRRHEHL